MKVVLCCVPICTYLDSIILFTIRVYHVCPVWVGVQMERDGVRRNNTDLAEEVTRLQQEVARLNAKASDCDVTF